MTGRDPGSVTLVPLPAGTGSDVCRLTAGGRSLMDSVEAIDLTNVASAGNSTYHPDPTPDRKLELPITPGTLLTPR